MPKGAGEIYIKAECVFVSKTYSILDTQFYDASSSSNVSKYTVPSGLSFSYDTSLSAYKIVDGTSSDGFPNLYLTDGTFSNECTVELDFYLANVSSNPQFIAGLFNANTNVRLDTRYVKANSNFGNEKFSSWGDRLFIDAMIINLAYNTWYHLVIQYTSSGITSIVKQGDTVLGTVTSTSNVLSSDNNKFNVGTTGSSGGRNQTWYVKNIKIL